MQIQFDHEVIIKELDDALKHLKRTEMRILVLKGAINDVVTKAEEEAEGE